jgi:FkbM family methyltransferase
MAAGLSVLAALIAFYTRRSPFPRGKTRLERLGTFALGQRTVHALSHYGTRFRLDLPEDHGWTSIYFRRTYETGTTDLIHRLLRPDDVAIDIGANIGWYTVHMARWARHGHCYAFEPTQRTFTRLQEHINGNSVTANVTLNQLALGDEDGQVSLYAFSGLQHGQNSLATFGREDRAEMVVPMTILDSYIHDRAITRIDLVKLDVEGAELRVLKGSVGVMRQPNPPIWIVEMNYFTSAQFGYQPSDLLSIFSQHGRYSFFRVDRGWGGVSAMASIRDFRDGDNVVCVPASRNDRWARIYPALETIAPIL